MSSNKEQNQGRLTEQQIEKIYQMLMNKGRAMGGSSNQGDFIHNAILYLLEKNQAPPTPPTEPGLDSDQPTDSPGRQSKLPALLDEGVAAGTVMPQVYGYMNWVLRSRFIDQVRPSREVPMSTLARQNDEGDWSEPEVVEGSGTFEVRNEDRSPLVPGRLDRATVLRQAEELLDHAARRATAQVREPQQESLKKDYHAIKHLCFHGHGREQVLQWLGYDTSDEAQLKKSVDRLHTRVRRCKLRLGQAAADLHNCGKWDDVQFALVTECLGDLMNRKRQGGATPRPPKKK